MKNPYHRITVGNHNLELMQFFDVMMWYIDIFWTGILFCPQDTERQSIDK